jgi:KaiC/GvpD/RAD55 family RecA-like ATPase
MKSLHRTLNRGVSSGEPLPDPFEAFAANKATFRRGSVVLIAAPPGGMKTVLTQNIVKNMKVPTLYNSSDSDDFTVTSRTLSMLTGEQTDETELWVLTQKREAYEALKEMNHVRWSFRSSPTLEHIAAEAEAYSELKGEYPHLIVIDIMMDIDFEGVAEQNYWALMAELKDMAREYEACVLVVHHTSESAKAGSPPPRSAIMGKANQLPTLILTLWGDAAANELMVAVVKNRFGPQDPTAGKYFKMYADPSICLIEDPREDGLKLSFKDGPFVPESEKIDWSKVDA